VAPRIRLPCAPDDPGMALKKPPPSPREQTRMFPKNRPSNFQNDRMWHSRYRVHLLHKSRSLQTRNAILVIQNNRGWHHQCACRGWVPRIFWTTGRPSLECHPRNFKWDIVAVFSEPQLQSSGVQGDGFLSYTIGSSLGKECCFLSATL
jgi:hypothetical protein